MSDMYDASSPLACASHAAIEHDVGSEKQNRHVHNVQDSDRGRRSTYKTQNDTPNNNKPQNIWQMNEHTTRDTQTLRRETTPTANKRRQQGDEADVEHKNNGQKMDSNMRQITTGRWAGGNYSSGRVRTTTLQYFLCCFVPQSFTRTFFRSSTRNRQRLTISCCAIRTLHSCSLGDLFRTSHRVQLLYKPYRGFCLKAITHQ